MIVHLEKELQYTSDSAMQRLADRGSDTIALDMSKAGPALAERDDALRKVQPGTTAHR